VPSVHTLAKHKLSVRFACSCQRNTCLSEPGWQQYHTAYRYASILTNLSHYAADRPAKVASCGLEVYKSVLPSAEGVGEGLLLLPCFLL
jgi:hypothetical protein